MTINDSKKIDFLPDCLQETGRSLLFGGLDPSDELTPLSSATLGQFKKSRTYVGAREAIIQDFFRDQENKVHKDSDNIDMYFHNVLQYNLFNFFEKEKGFTFIGDCSVVDDQLSSSKKIKAECGLNMTFSAYSDAFIFFSSDKEKLLIKIEQGYYKSGTFYYEIIYTGENEQSIMQEWSVYSRKNNFYKKQRINDD